MLENTVKTKNVHPYEVCVPFVTNFLIAERTICKNIINRSLESVKRFIKQNQTHKSN